MKGRIYMMLMGIAMIMRSVVKYNRDMMPNEYKIPDRKVKRSYVQGKTFYQNPNLKMRVYHNKIPRKNKFSTISLRGKEIKVNNKRKSIENKLKNMRGTGFEPA